MACQSQNTCESTCTGHNGFVFIIVLYILLAIILGTCAF